MAMNEEGEFELVLGNKQLFSVFFIVVVLLGVCFLMGYVVGKNSAPVLNAAVAPAGEREPLVVPTAAPQESAKAEVPKATGPQTAPQVDASPAPSERRVDPVAAPAPAASKPLLPGLPDKGSKASTKQVPLGSQPIAGRVYLQLSATDRDSAEAMADVLRGRGFSAIAAQIRERPELYRVLVGPMSDDDIPRTRADLKSKNFPSDQAVRRVF